MKIDKAFFENCVPAFKTPDDKIFNRLQQFIATETMNLEAVIGPHADEYFAEDDRCANVAAQYICLRSARLAIPELDLVLTSTGFGIVSTNNVAPASRDRVAALTEHLRHTESLAYDLLLTNLAMFTSWKDTEYCATVICSLLWNAGLLRGNGVTLEGEAIYQEEYEKMLPKLHKAENMLTDIISYELYLELVKSLLQTTSNPPEPFRYVRNLSVRFLVAYMTTESAAIEQDKLQLYLEQYADEFPSYKNSAIYKATHVPHYENKKDNKCHFW